MKMKKSNIRILGLLILVMAFFTALCFSSPVFAQEDKKEDEKTNLAESDDCKDYLKKNLNNFNEKYGVTIDYNVDVDNPYFTVTLKGNDNIWKLFSKKSDVKFTVSEIWITNIPDDKDFNYQDIDSNKDIKVYDSFTTRESLEQSFKGITSKVLSQGNTITINSLSTYRKSPVRYFVVLSPSGFKDPDLKKKCGDDTNFKISVKYDAYGLPSVAKPTVEPLTQPVTTSAIDCSKSHSENSFEYSYCADLKAAEEAAKKDSSVKVNYSQEKDTYEKMFGNKPISLKCDPFGPLNADNNSDEYYKNKNYRIGSLDTTLNVGEYIYHYGGRKIELLNGVKTWPTVTKNGQKYLDLNSKDIKVTYGKTTSEAISCKIKCTEVLTVEYGAPVASKAGLCFEYKVKVTSRVNCVGEAPNQPKVANYCTPSPGCNHGSGFVDKGAGPNEDFDACVDKCDGGRYTPTCSKKCYNAVYGSASSTKTDTDFMEYTATQLAYHSYNTRDRDFKHEFQGLYFNNDGTIIWLEDNRLGRWYKENNYTGNHGCLKTYNEGGGILAICGCSARCRWNGCTGNYYLNPTTEIDGVIFEGEAELDYAANKKLYESAVNKCNSYSRCSTSQAEFAINVDYTYNNKNGNEETTKIYFPYSSNKESKDTIQYTPETKTVACTSKNANSTIISSNGCYKCAEGNSGNDQTASSSNWYQTEWSFPGTWIHNKTGEVSYEQKTGKSWIEYKDKFCVPLDAKNVNEVWWDAYYLSHFGSDSTTTYSYQDTEYQANSENKCVITSCKTAEQLKSDIKDLKYNINATARKFGLFGWNINISCFYALNNSFPTETTCTRQGNCASINAVARPVDLNNLFPATDGSKLTSSGETGRSPGFNWSTYAKNTKDGNYVSNPSEYTKWVQTNGYNVYSDDYLDYEVTLTKEMINKLKSSNRNYTAFDGESVLGSVVNYRSNLFRGSNAILANYSKVPNEAALKCNNMKNYASSECEVIKNSGVN